MKILLSVLIICSTTFIGFCFKEYYKKRERFFSDIIAFCNSSKIQVAFFEKRISEILKSENLFGFEFAALLKNIESDLKEKKIISNTNKLSANIFFLNIDEKKQISHFFENFGKLDLESEVKNIENNQQLFQNSLNKAKEENKKYGGACLKLGIIFGVMIAIVLA